MILTKNDTPWDDTVRARMRGIPNANSIFSRPDQRLQTETKRQIFQQHRRGDSVEALTHVKNKVLEIKWTPLLLGPPSPARPPLPEGA